MMKTKNMEGVSIPTAPKPDYNKCNSGHELTPVYNHRLKMYTWDCVWCFHNNPKIGGK